MSSQNQSLNIYKYFINGLKKRCSFTQNSIQSTSREKIKYFIFGFSAKGIKFDYTNPLISFK